jgi:Short repeat of unknown function (DUF308)
VARNRRDRAPRKLSDRVRRRVVVALTVLSAVLLATAAVAGYARYELRDAGEFSARVTSSLDDADVRDLVADTVVDGISNSAAPDVIAVRPVVVSALSSVAGTDPFRRVFARAIRDQHRSLFYGRARVALDLDYAGTLLRETLRGVSPRIASAIPRGTEPRLIALGPDDVRVRIARALENLAGWWWPLLVAGALLAVGCAALAGGMRAALAHLGASIAAAGLTVALLVSLAGAAVVDQVAGHGDARSRGAAEALWSALFGDLRRAALYAALAGVVVCGATLRFPAGALVRRLAGAARADTPVAHVVRGVMLIALGVAALAEPGLALRAVTLLAGLLLVLLGTAELRSRIVREPASEQEPAGAPGRGAATGSPLLIGAIVAGVVVVAALAAMAVLPAPKVASPLAAASTPTGGCNGSTVLCDRRLDEVVFPSTHNSFAASSQPGWLFANQRFGIERQLRDGIRGFLIDIHYGQPDPQSGLVRTDLEAEGMSHNKVAQQLSPQALRTAERLAGRAGLGGGSGTPRPFLCHTLCELGSEPLDQELTVVREFLDAHPGEVVVLFLESYVPVEETERALERTGLLSEAAEIERDQPLPTLGQLVADRTRLVVLTERDGGSRPWYLDGFSFAQDTPLSATKASELSCRRWRGTPDSPLLLLNHWTVTFPPSPSRNERIGNSVLRRQIADCERERSMRANLVAVDFYERTGVLRIAHQLNERTTR